MAIFSFSVTVQKQFEKIAKTGSVKVYFSSENNQDMKDLVKFITNALSEPETHCTLIFSPLKFFNFYVSNDMCLDCKYIDYASSEPFSSGTKATKDSKVYIESMDFETYQCQYTKNSVIEQFIINNI